MVEAAVDFFSGAAPEERTTEPGRYKDGGIQGLYYWDLPAIDEFSPSKKYFEKYHLYAFDHVLFLKSCRPHQGEEDVLKRLQVTFVTPKVLCEKAVMRVHTVSCCEPTVIRLDCLLNWYSSRCVTQPTLVR